MSPPPPPQPPQKPVDENRYKQTSVDILILLRNLKWQWVPHVHPMKDELTLLSVDKYWLHLSWYKSLDTSHM